MTKHSASCLGYICTCDNCYRCEGIIKDLRAENARYREALEFAIDMLKACQPWVTGYGLRHDSEKALEKAREALKGGE
jgi:hypothetical protein